MHSKVVAFILSATAAVTVVRARTLRPDLDLPVTFIENQGQKDTRVRYYAQGNGYAFYLTSDAIVLALPEGSTAVRFLGANTRARMEGESPAAGAIHYLHGNDPARWHTDLPHYSQVVYRDLWPGIDLRLSRQHASLKYEFHVRPGASPADIRLAYATREGSRSTRAARSSSGLLMESCATPRRSPIRRSTASACQWTAAIA